MQTFALCDDSEGYQEIRRQKTAATRNHGNRFSRDADVQWEM